MGDYPGAEEHFVPPDFMFNSNAHCAIVIHKTGGDATPAAVYSTFLASGRLPDTDPRHKRSSHYAVGQDGTIWQFVPEAKGAGANGIPDSSAEPFWDPYRHDYGNLNLCTLSVEHCDPMGDNSTPLTPEQKKASFQLVAHLASKYSIPYTHIKPHKSICATACPGNYPMEELQQFIQTGGKEDDMLQITDPFAKAYFTQVAGDRWHCVKTNRDVAYSILDFYRSIGGAPRLPLTGEQYDIPEVVYQVFEAGVIVYDPHHKLDHPTGFERSYLLRLDSELAKRILQ
jgi:hypothetical protein